MVIKMIKLIEEQNESLYIIQKKLNLGMYTLYRYAKRQRDIKNMPFNMLYKLSNYFGIDMNTLYIKMCEYEAKKGVK